MKRGCHRRITAQKDHRPTGNHAFPKGRKAICQARALGHCRNADVSSDLRVGLSHKNCAAFVGCRNHRSTASVNKVVCHEKVGVAHQTKHGFNAMIAHSLCDGLVHIHFFI